MVGLDCYRSADLNVQTRSRNLGARDLKKVGLPITQVGNGLLLQQHALAVLQVQLHFARELGDGNENLRGRAHQLDNVQPRNRGRTEADHPEENAVTAWPQPAPLVPGQCQSRRPGTE
jgi:hypothetical protein